MKDTELLALHRDLVAIPSISHQEQALCDHLEHWLRARDVPVERFGNNLFAVAGNAGDHEARYLCFNSHLDTVPPSPSWTRPPHQVDVVDGRVYGLGSNDAKASVVCMIAAFLRLRPPQKAPPLLLSLVCDEETGGKGTEVLLPHLHEQGYHIEAAIVGEPTGLEVVVAQKGLLVLELRTQGHACHAAHGQALGAPNALRLLAHDLVALDAVDLGPDHPMLGKITVEPTMAQGGTSRNTIPSEATCLLDVRTNPAPGQMEIASRLRSAVRGELQVVSDRLRPCEIAVDHKLVMAARQARPEAKLLGSRGVSDWVWFSAHRIPAIKAGPGQTERSHTPDEFVLEKELVEGASFYEKTALAYGDLMGATQR